jgi:fermentation-respiration switch protein FrsA (DUF1100 family)
VEAPWLVVHGTADETVDVESAARLHAAAPRRSTLRLVEGADHTFGARHPMGSPPPAADDAIRATTDFFVRHLLD